MPAYGPLSYTRPGVPQGRISEKLVHTSKLYGGMQTNYWIYVPAQYDPAVPAALMVWQDGERYITRNVEEIVPALSESVPPAGSHRQPDSRQEDSGDDPRLRVAGHAGRQDLRSVLYDTVSDKYGQFLLEELLPEVYAKYNIRKDAYSRAIQGQSSGGIAAFTVAFNHPESFSRVYTVVGSFIALQWRPGELDGGNIYPFKVRREPKRNLRVWMNDGSEDQEANSGKLAAAEHSAGELAEDEGIRLSISASAAARIMRRWPHRSCRNASPGCGGTTIRRRPNRSSSRAPRRRRSRCSASASTTAELTPPPGRTYSAALTHKTNGAAEVDQPRVEGLMRLALLAVGSSPVCVSGLGADLYGTLVGNVTDETGLAVPGATVKITHTETSQSRESTTNSTGGYNFPNIPTGTYQVDVALTGFQSASSRGVVVSQNTSVRVDVRLTVGTLQETVLVSGTAAVLQTESAAVQMQTTSEQIVNLPTAGRSYQSFIGLMPGVAAPYMIQAGGINNPARSMGVSVNGQPPNNTLFRVDGAAVTNQWYPDIQSYSPALEAVETVSVVTNSFDADQGMAGGAAVNVQVKSGTNSVSGSLFEYLTDSALKNRPYFLPAGRRQGQGHKNIFGGTMGGPIVRNKLFFFVSVESEVRRVKDGTVQLAEGEVSTGTTGLNTLPPAALRAGNFSATRTRSSTIR